MLVRQVAEMLRTTVIVMASVRVKRVARTVTVTMAPPVHVRKVGGSLSKWLKKVMRKMLS